jgi:hypothetical protein
VAHQRRDMGGTGLGHGVGVVTALQGRRQFAAAVFLGNHHQKLGQPREITGREPQVAERITQAGVETGGDEQQRLIIPMKY